MKKIPFRLIILFIFLVFLQIWLFDNIHLFGFATPLLYIYFLIKLPISMNRNIVILLSALLGFIIDIFGGSLGLSMTALVMVGFLRYYLLKLLRREMFLTTILPLSAVSESFFSCDTPE